MGKRNYVPVASLPDGNVIPLIPIKMGKDGAELNTDNGVLLASMTIDLSVVGNYTVFNVKKTEQVYITKTLIEAATGLTVAAFSLGYNKPQNDNVIANATYPEIVDDKTFTIVYSKTGVRKGVGGDKLKLSVNNPEIGASVTITVFGITEKV